MTKLAFTRGEIEQALAQARLKDANWETWLRTLFPEHVTYPFAPHLEDFWKWVFSIEPLKRPRPFVACWARGGAKSSSGEMAKVIIGARKIRKYGLYVSRTQDQADDHVGNVGAMMEGQNVFPEIGEKLVTKHGQARGWRRNRLRAANGFTIDALGLDSAVRGAKLDAQRPDAMWFDDIDKEDDSPAVVEDNIRTITRKILPAGGEGLAVLFIQNLILEKGVIGQLLSGEADFLSDAIISGPVPALRNMVSVGNTLISGDPTWVGQNFQRCQEFVTTYGMSAFVKECQHEVSDLEGGMFNHVEFRHAEYSDDLLRGLDRVVCWVDPAVSDTDRSDANGIQIDGIRGRVKYRLFSWEQRSSPLETLKVAISKAIEYGAQHVGVETDQGGDLWRDEYKAACRSLGKFPGSPYGTPTWAPPFRAAKAGSGFGSKQERAQRQLVNYERYQYVHVVGGPNGATSTHGLLEKALGRFPLTKPHDLVDAGSWCAIDLGKGSGDEILTIPHPTRGKLIPQVALSREEEAHWREVEEAERKLEAVRRMINA